MASPHPCSRIREVSQFKSEKEFLSNYAALYPGGQDGTVTLSIRGMTCSSCVHTIEAALAKLPGVTEVAVALATERGRVR